MRKFLRFMVLFLLFWVAACVIEVCHVDAQSINKISSRCPSPLQLTSSSVFTKADGNNYYTPCSGFSNLFFGIVDFSNASSVIFPGGGTGVSGTGTTNYIPRWTNGASSILGNTPNSWDGTTYLWNNTALSGNWLMSFVPSVTTTGTFTVGRAAQTVFTMTGSTRTVDFNTFLSSGSPINARLDNLAGTFTVNVGDATTGLMEITAVGGGVINMFGAASVIVNTALFNQTNVTSTSLNRTITAAGTTGNRTINKPNGTVNFAAAATDIVVTNSTATTTSLINCAVQSLDATAISCRITDKAPGSFHVRVPAATGETSVAFWVWN